MLSMVKYTVSLRCFCWVLLSITSVQAAAGEYQIGGLWYNGFWGPSLGYKADDYIVYGAVGSHLKPDEWAEDTENGRFGVVGAAKRQIFVAERHQAFIGLVAGHLAGSKTRGHHYMQEGIGFEMSYLWAGDNLDFAGYFAFTALNSTNVKGEEVDSKVDGLLGASVTVPFSAF